MDHSLSALVIKSIHFFDVLPTAGALLLLYSANYLGQALPHRVISHLRESWVPHDIWIGFHPHALLCMPRYLA